jgi:hypothetical protein
MMIRSLLVVAAVLAGQGTRSCPPVYRTLVERQAATRAKRIVIYHQQSGEAVPGCSGS